MAQSMRLSVALAILASSTTFAHEHHEEALPEGQYTTPEPIDSILWLHIFTMIVAFGILFPTGMVLGLVRNRWHVPTQVLASCLAILGWFLGHAHKGRQFGRNIHATYAPFVMFNLVLQVLMGLYLKLHWEKGWHGRVRGMVVKMHGVVGKIMPVTSWVQMLFGGIVA